MTTSTADTGTCAAGIRPVIKERIAALRDRDATRLAAMYTSEIVKFDLAPPLKSSGSRVTDPAARRPWLGTWTGPITLGVTELYIVDGDDIALCHSLNRMRGTKTLTG